MEYKEFLESKEFVVENLGFKIDVEQINNILFDYQKAIVKWSLFKGNAAIMLDCGLGKTFIQLEYARLIVEKYNKPALIVAPLSVALQSIEESKKINIDLKYIQDDNITLENKIYITNYERLHNFEGQQFICVVLDESSILKSIIGKTKKICFSLFKDTKFKMSCSATPSPNDIVELANQVEFLGVMTRQEMLSKFFVNEQHTGVGWRLKKNSVLDFYKWVSQWAIFARKPSDLGFSDEGFELPELNIEALYTDSTFIREGELFATQELKGITDRLKIRRDTLKEKVELIKRYVDKNPNEQFLIWCGLNEEADFLEKNFKGSVQLSGSDIKKSKIDKILDFKNKEIKVLITKPKIAGFGMNFQNCFNVIFIGLSDSYESYYQSIRRCYRYGQKNKVNVKIVLNISEQQILTNVLQKEKHTNDLYNGVIKETSHFAKSNLCDFKINKEEEYYMNKIESKDWMVELGDSVETIKKLADNSIDLMIYSPPFQDLYVYNDSKRDISNCKNKTEYFEHMKFLIKEQIRILKPGRLICVHCTQLTKTLNNDGKIGIKDFRGDLVNLYESLGLNYQSEFIIDKCPKKPAVISHIKGLQFSQLKKDSSWMRAALPDYILVFRKDGENETPINSIKNGEIDNNTWVTYAHPVWYGIKPTDTLNRIKFENDEKHMTPLQLEVIRRLVVLYSNPNETIYSPFMGIGSEGYVAIKNNRKFIGCELKKEYFDVAVKNLKEAEQKKEELMLF